MMARVNQTIREYSITNDLMLEHAQTTRNSFDTDNAAFTAEYSMFDLTFSDDWQADIYAAQALPTADEGNMKLKAKTEDIDTSTYQTKPSEAEENFRGYDYKAY